MGPEAEPPQRFPYIYQPAHRALPQWVLVLTGTSSVNLYCKLYCTCTSAAARVASVGETRGREATRDRLRAVASRRHAFAVFLHWSVYVQGVIMLLGSLWRVMHDRVRASAGEAGDWAPGG